LVIGGGGPKLKTLSESEIDLRRHPFGPTGSCFGRQTGESAAQRRRTLYVDIPNDDHANADHEVTDACCASEGLTTGMFTRTGPEEDQDQLPADHSWFRAAIDTVMEPFSVWEPLRAPDGRVEDFRAVYANAAALRSPVVPREGVVGGVLSRLLPAGLVAALFPRLRHVLESGIASALEGYELEHLPRQSSDLMAFDVQIAPVEDKIALVWRDVTARHRDAQRLAASERRYRLLAENSTDMITLSAPDGRVTFVSPASQTLLGRAPEEVAEARAEELVHTDDLARVREARQSLLAQPRPLELTFRMLRSDGSWTWVERVVRPVMNPLSGELIEWHEVTRDITSRQQFEDELRHHALHDRLTGLANRTLLLDRLDQAIRRASRTGASVAALFIDLDNFKVVNDSLGHDAGDRLLVEFAHRLEHTVRGVDTAARLGGDEFVVVCADLRTDEELRHIGERLRRALAEPCRIDGSELHVTASIGVAHFDGSVATHTDSPEDMLRDADLAMYHAKEQGKNQLSMFNTNLRDRATTRLWAEIGLRRALRHDELRVYYQPIVCLDTQAVSGYEALVRWDDPERGWQEPGSFLSVAESTDLITPIGAHVFATACEQLAAWQLITPDLSMSVNLSLRQLGHAELPEIMGDVIARTGLDPVRIRLEVTETVLMEAGDTHTKQLEALADLGVRLGIDDFGTGYASLTYLKRFPVSFLKIDQSFVHGLGHRREDTAIVGAVVALGHDLGLDTIAEGVETEDQLDIIRELGVTHAQGYYLARPLAADLAVKQLTP
jgi:diguanylate cyclase (GGDEF)-like protein/PAS domain S-box-containing protein